MRRTSMAFACGRGQRRPRLPKQRRGADGADSEDDLKGSFDDLDVNSSKLSNTVARRNEKLVRLRVQIDAIVADLEGVGA